MLCSVVVLGTLSVLTWRRCGVFESGLTLWSDTVERNPGSWEAHYNLGIALAAEGELDGAIGHYRRALRLDPEVSNPHNNLGIALRSRGEIEQAIDHYRDDWIDRVGTIF